MNLGPFRACRATIKGVYIVVDGAGEVVKQAPAYSSYTAADRMARFLNDVRKSAASGVIDQANKLADEVKELLTDADSSNTDTRIPCHYTVLQEALANYGDARDQFNGTPASAPVKPDPTKSWQRPPNAPPIPPNI